VDWIEPGREREMEERLTRMVVPQEGDSTLFGELRDSIGSYMHFGHSAEKITKQQKSKQKKKNQKRRDVKKVNIPIKFEGESTGLIEGVKETLKNKTEDAKKFIEDTVSNVNTSMAPGQDIMKDLRKEMAEEMKEHAPQRGSSKKFPKSQQRMSANTGEVESQSVPVAFVLIPTSGNRNFGAEA